MSKRCSCFAISTSRICRNKFSFIINNKRCCYIHAKYEYNKYAIYIQKCWTGYRSRCMMTKIYTQLPDDLQRKIAFYVRENYLIKKHHYDVINKIIKSKIDFDYIRNALIIIQNNFERLELDVDRPALLIDHPLDVPTLRLVD